jgi:hypothetical protein
MHTRHEMYAEGFWSMISFVIPYLFYTSYFAERKWSEKTVNPVRSVFNFLFFLLIPERVEIDNFTKKKFNTKYENNPNKDNIWPSRVFSLPDHLVVWKPCWLFAHFRHPALYNFILFILYFLQAINSCSYQIVSTRTFTVN